MLIKLGCDPELFLKDPSTGQYISAHTILPGTKLEPYKVPQGAIQVDGTAAEFNIEPALSSQQFRQNISTVMADLKTRVKDMELVFDPTVTFEPSYFETLPETVRELGCNPDFNAWTGQVNPSPDGGSTTMRTASGHIHIGWTEDVNPLDPSHFADCLEVVKQLDYYLGIFSLLWDPDNKRRQLYGKAGAFRPKSYGVEYRTLSNVWLRSSRVQDWIWSAVNKACTDLTKKDSMESVFGSFAREVIDNNVTNWMDDRKGKNVLLHTGLSIPDYKSCLQAPKVKTTEEARKDAIEKSIRRKTKANPKFYSTDPTTLAQDWFAVHAVHTEISN